MTRIRWQSFVDEGTNAPYLERLSTWLNANAGPGTEVEVIGMSPADRDFGRLSEFRCSVTAVANAIAAEEDGCDAFVFGHFQEPGLYEARAAAAIPVVGIGESSLLWASQVGRHIGLISIHPVYRPIHEEQVERYGLASRLCGIRALGATVESFTGAFAGSAADRAALVAQFDEAARELIADGADVIVIAGGLFGLLIAGDRGYAVDGVPVVNCTPVGLAWAQMAIRVRELTGMTAGDGPCFAPGTGTARADFLAMRQQA